MRTDRVRGDSFNGWTVKAIDCLWGLAIVLCVWGCKGMPPVAQQEQVRVQLSTSLLAVLSQVLLARSDKPGRLAGYEFLVVTPAISNLIRENKTFRIDSAIQTGKKFGMQLLDEHLWTIYSKGLISAEEMVDKARNPGDLSERVRRSGVQLSRTELEGTEA